MEVNPLRPLKGTGEKRGRRDQTQQRMSRKAGLIPVRAHSVFINHNNSCLEAVYIVK